VVLPWIVLTAAIYGVILFGGFVKAVGTDNTPTVIVPSASGTNRFDSFAIAARIAGRWPAWI
jgi:hypothetical protein